MKYKAGIAPARYSKKSSEYQKQYGWKKGFPASPLLASPIWELDQISAMKTDRGMLFQKFKSLPSEAAAEGELFSKWRENFISKVELPRKERKLNNFARNFFPEVPLFIFPSHKC